VYLSWGYSSLNVPEDSSNNLFTFSDKFVYSWAYKIDNERRCSVSRDKILDKFQIREPIFSKPTDDFLFVFLSITYLKKYLLAAFIDRSCKPLQNVRAQ
jgi:hypothetical protein